MPIIETLTELGCRLPRYSSRLQNLFAFGGRLQHLLELGLGGVPSIIHQAIEDNSYTESLTCKH